MHAFKYQLGQGVLIGCDRPPEIYIRFNYLTAHQQGAIVVAIAGLHRAILSSAREIEPSDLFIESVHTGDSIKCKFRQGRVLPGWDFPEDDLVILLPRWSAALFLAGGLLIGGARVLNAVEDIRDHLPPNAPPQQEEVLRKTFDLAALGDPATGPGREARRHLGSFAV